MRELFAGLKRWYQRRFHGVVAPPRQYGGTGTTWQQHSGDTLTFTCRCGDFLDFTEKDYVVREQEHAEGCAGVTDATTNRPARLYSKLIDLRPCSCPVTDARYVKICRNCRLGHWKDASPK